MISNRKVVVHIFSTLQPLKILRGTFMKAEYTEILVLIWVRTEKDTKNASQNQKIIKVGNYLLHYQLLITNEF